MLHLKQLKPQWLNMALLIPSSSKPWDEVCCWPIFCFQWCASVTEPLRDRKISSKIRKWSLAARIRVTESPSDQWTAFGSTRESQEKLCQYFGSWFSCSSCQREKYFSLAYRQGRCPAKFLTCEISDFTPCAHAQSNILLIKYAETNWW